MNHYQLFKEKIKILSKKYIFGEQFIDYIDNFNLFQVKKEDNNIKSYNKFHYKDEWISRGQAFLSNRHISLKENKIISIEFANEILLHIDNDIKKKLDEISLECKTFPNIFDGDIYCLWKIIYIKYFNPIIIIGSGISGLTIASGLDNDNFLILEARDRIGGRVFTNDKNNLDMGAAWIHGSENNPLNKFLDMNNLIPISSSNPWMHSENILIKYLNKFEISEEKRQLIAKKWTNIAFKISNIDNKTILEAFNEINKQGCSEEKNNEDEEILYSFLYMIEVWCGGSVKNISTSFLNDINNKQSLFGDYGGSHYLFKNGASTLLDGIIKSSKYNLLDKIKYNEIVTDIIYNNYYVEIHTTSGKIYYCNKVCITVPPGPLKDINFSPPLSKNKIESLSKIKMGSYKKIQLEFNEEDIFWNKDIPMFLTYNSESTCNLEKNQKQDIPYILWNNYKYSKNKPIIEAICPAEIGWKLTGKTDEEIIDLILSQLQNYFPNIPEPKA